MTIHTAGSNGLALFLDTEDLSRMGFEKETLDEPAARTLMRDTLTDMGVSAELVEISAFIGKGGAMLVALLDGGSWAFYQLLSPDALLDVWLTAGAAHCRFYAYQDEYYIAVREQTAPKTILERMPEFGARVYRPQNFLAFLEEHAKLCPITV